MLDKTKNKDKANEEEDRDKQNKGGEFHTSQEYCQSYLRRSRFLDDQKKY